MIKAVQIRGRICRAPLICAIEAISNLGCKVEDRFEAAPVDTQLSTGYRFLDYHEA